MNPRLTSLLAVGLRIVAVGLSVGLLFVVDALFGTEAAGIYQTYVAYAILVGGIASIGIPYAAISTSVDEMGKSLDLLVFAFFCTVVIAAVCIVSSLIFNVNAFLLFLWWPFAIYQIFAARMKISNNVLSSIFFENVAPHMTFLSIIVSMLVFNASELVAFTFSFQNSIEILLMVISPILFVGFLLYFRYHLRSWASDIRFLIDSLSTRAKYNFGTLLSSLPFNKVELFIFAYFGMMSEAGAFAKVLVLANITSMPVNFSASLFIPQFVAALREKEVEISSEIFLKYRKLAFRLTLGISILAISAVLFHLYLKSEFSIVLILTAILICAGNLVTAFAGHYHYALIAIGREHECTKLNSFALVANILTAIILIPYFAELGAAISILVMNCTRSITGAKYMKDYLRHE